MTNTKEEPMRDVPQWTFVHKWTGDEVVIYADTPEEAEEEFYRLYPYV